MRLIDVGFKGNAVRLYLGEKTEEYGWTNADYISGNVLPPYDTFYGDDWDDVPYEHNAGPVYPWFVKGTKDILFPYDAVILEPCDGKLNSGHSMESIMVTHTPRFIAIFPDAVQKLADAGYDEWQFLTDFNEAMTIVSIWEAANNQKLHIEYYYLGDEVKE